MATMNGNIIMNAPIEINDVCRGCLDSRREMRPLYGACLDEMLMSITTVQVKKDDGLPSLMCIQCILQLSRAYSFKQTCEKSDATLKLYINAALQNSTSFDLTESNSAVTSCMASQDQLSSQRKIESTEDTIDSEDIGDCTLICIDEDNSDGYIELVEFQHDIKTEEQSLDPDEVMKPEMDDISLNENSFDMKGHIGFSKPVNIASSSSNHLLPEYHCKKCGETFEMEIDLNLHMVLHPPDNKCETCGKSFVERGSLRRHLKTHLENKPHACETCNKTFADLSNLKKHKKTHTGELRNVQGKPHLCSVCGRGFKWASSLSKHSKYHSGRKLLSCKYCTKQYVEARSLRIHMRSHTGEKPYICSVCTRGFTQQSNLEKHLRVHTGERPHICNVCGKGFSQRGYVTIHMRTHTGEKPYVCKTCGKAFSGANTLNTHKRIHTGERPFNCDVCGKFFSRQETLIIHQRTHTGEKPHICTICSKGFSSSSHLSGHMRSHTGVKPHCCNLCDKRFANSSSLKMHMRSHTGEKPFICDYCGEAFICNSSLLSHIMIHTNIAPIVQEPSANLEIVTTNGCLPQWEIDNKSTPLALPSNSDIKSTTALVTQWIEPSGQLITSTEVAARTLPITQWNMNSKPATLDQTAETGFENLNNVKYSV